MKLKRGDYQATLLFMLTLALLSAFAGLLPLWDAQLRGSYDSFFPMFSVIYVFNAVIILLAMLEWRRAALLLSLTWLTTMGISLYWIPDSQSLSAIIGMILMAFFLDEIYARWSNQFKKLQHKDELTNVNTYSQVNSDDEALKMASYLNRLSDIIDDEVSVEQESQLSKHNRSSNDDSP